MHCEPHDVQCSIVQCFMKAWCCSTAFADSDRASCRLSMYHVAKKIMELYSSSSGGGRWSQGEMVPVCSLGVQIEQ